MIDNVNFYFSATALLRQIQGNTLDQIGKAIIIGNLHSHALNVYVSQGSEVVFGQRLVQRVVGVSADQRLPLGKSGYHQGVIKVATLVSKLYHIALKYACRIRLNPIRADATVLRREAWRSRHKIEEIFHAAPGWRAVGLVNVIPAEIRGEIHLTATGIDAL